MNDGETEDQVRVRNVEGVVALGRQPGEGVVALRVGLRGRRAPAAEGDRGAFNARAVRVVGDASADRVGQARAGEVHRLVAAQVWDVEARGREGEARARGGDGVAAPDGEVGERVVAVRVRLRRAGLGAAERHGHAGERRAPGVGHAPAQGESPERALEDDDLVVAHRGELAALRREGVEVVRGRDGVRAAARQVDEVVVAVLVGGGRRVDGAGERDGRARDPAPVLVERGAVDAERRQGLEGENLIGLDVAHAATRRRERVVRVGGRDGVVAAARQLFEGVAAPLVGLHCRC